MDDEQPRRERPDPAAASSDRPTLKTIAFMTGLGVTTVSRALKDAPEIGEETRKRVQLVARQVGYRPNRAGVRLRTGKTNVISLVLDTEEQVGGFVSDIIYGISEVLAETPYHLIVTPYSRTNDPMEPVRYIVETGSADGIIISRTQPDDPRVRYMAERGFPFVTHGRTAMDVAHPFHDFDNRAFAEIAVRRLAELGRRRLALLAPPSYLTYSHHMRAGFLDAIAAHGLSARPTPFLAVTIDNSIEQIRLATMELMGGPRGRTASSAAPAAPPSRWSRASRRPASCSAATSTSCQSRHSGCCCWGTALPAGAACGRRGRAAGRPRARQGGDRPHRRRRWREAGRAADDRLCVPTECAVGGRLRLIARAHLHPDRRSAAEAC